MGQASATYLLGYTREMIHDGRFHEIKVRVKRGGYDVRARAGYWAPRPGDVEKAKVAAAAAVLPAPIASAFAALTPPNSARLVETWIGVRPAASGPIAGDRRMDAAARPAGRCQSCGRQHRA